MDVGKGTESAPPPDLPQNRPLGSIYVAHCEVSFLRIISILRPYRTTMLCVCAERAPDRLATLHVEHCRTSKSSMLSHVTRPPRVWRTLSCAPQRAWPSTRVHGYTRDGGVANFPQSTGTCSARIIPTEEPHRFYVLPFLGSTSASRSSLCLLFTICIAEAYHCPDCLLGIWPQRTARIDCDPPQT